MPWNTPSESVDHDTVFLSYASGSATIGQLVLPRLDVHLHTVNDVKA